MTRACATLLAAACLAAPAWPGTTPAPIPAPAPHPALAALWHSPHDVIAACAISPDFERDRTLFVAASRFQLLLRSTDGGDSFEPINVGLHTALVDRLSISPRFAQDRTLYCAEARGAFRSVDAGDTWTSLTLPDGVLGASGLAVAADGALLLASKSGGVWRSADGGETWVAPAQPDPPVTLKRLRSSTSGARVGGLTNDGRMLLSADGGVSFGERPLKGIAAPMTLVLDDRTNDLWIGAAAGGVFHSTDRGRTWSPINDGLRDLSVQHLALSWVGKQPSLIAATREAGVFVRLGDHPWTLLSDGMRENSVQTSTHYRSVHITPKRSRNGSVFAGTFQGLHRLDGGSWTHLDVLPGTLVRNLVLSPSIGEDGRFWLSTYGHGLIAAEDLGRTLRRIDSGDVGHPDGVGVARDGTLAVGRPGGLLMSTDDGLTWKNRPTTARGFPRTISFAPDFESTGAMFAHTSISGVANWHGFFRTQDQGVNWEPVGPSSVACIEYADDFASSGRLWVGTKKKLWASTDRGATWDTISEFPGEAVKDVSSRQRDGTEELLVLLTDPGATRVVRSIDGGASWQPCGEGLEGHFVQFVSHAGAELAFAATRSRGVLVSRGADCRWEPTAPGPESVFAFGVSEGFESDRTLVAGTYRGAWVSEDAGESWRLVRAESPAPVGESDQGAPTDADGNH
jgi:photosystem II stability/assembly factor-like uncharacterized protein